MGNSALLLLTIPMESNLNFLWEILNESVKCTEYKYRVAGSWNTLPFVTTAAPSLQAFKSGPVRTEFLHWFCPAHTQWPHCWKCSNFQGSNGQIRSFLNQAFQSENQITLMWNCSGGSHTCIVLFQKWLKMGIISVCWTEPIFPSVNESSLSKLLRNNQQQHQQKFTTALLHSHCMKTASNGQEL